jgi:hypothetical protein
MKRNGRVTLLAFLAVVVAAGFYSVWTRVRSPESTASSDSNGLWIALIKGLNGDVHYVGSDDRSSYFRVGRVFWSYYKVPVCAARLPETFSVGAENPYVVRPHVRPDNTIHSERACFPDPELELGELDRG